jgi:hypothetical protein
MIDGQCVFASGRLPRPRRNTVVILAEAKGAPGYPLHGLDHMATSWYTVHTLQSSQQGTNLQYVLK